MEIPSDSLKRNATVFSPARKSLVGIRRRMVLWPPWTIPPRRHSGVCISTVSWFRSTHAPSLIRTDALFW